MLQSRPFITLVAGGTGGHVMPAVAIAHEIVGRGINLSILTDERGFHYWPLSLQALISIVPSGNIRTRRLLHMIPRLFQLIRGFFKVLQYFLQHRPRVVMGFGGYPTLMPLLAAWVLRIPIVINEQDSRIGWVNRVFKRMAAQRFATFPLDETRFPFEPVGLPARPSMVTLLEKPYALPTAGQPLTILIVGGSQAARVFSAVIPNALKLLSERTRRRLTIIHQCPQADVAPLEKQYEHLGVAAVVKHFFTDMDVQLSHSHLVISRCGASTLSELSLSGRPAILVPLPTAADDHQRKNALFFSQKNAAWLVAERNFTPEHLAEQLQALINDPRVLSATSERIRRLAKPHAARHIADALESYVRKAAHAPTS